MAIICGDTGEISDIGGNMARGTGIKQPGRRGSGAVMGGRVKH